MAMTSSVVTREIWAARDGVKLHAVEWRPSSGEGGVPILGIGGALSNAWNAEELGIAAASGGLGAPRRLISPDRRGMGVSSAPPSGYTPTEFARDNEAMLAVAELEDLVVYGHSLGVPIAIAYALAHRDTVRGLVLGDYPAVWPRLSEEWLARALASFEVFPDREAAFQAVRQRELAGPRTADEAHDRDRFARFAERFLRERDGHIEEIWSRDAIRQMQRESVEAPYWDELARLDVPVLAITGTDVGVRVKPDDAERYRRACGDASLVVIDGADHSLTVDGDQAPFFAALRGFLADVDRRESAR
ncbi:MAG TPA: alpha/beta hydrolase [Candidatus Limnocylindria bacterium]|jgi:pimeloyl-ACP methyl ester carboxylesterase|nr:alpha/beta hydrolase [Candidatus Limnocylindria bacterium]